MTPGVKKLTQKEHVLEYLKAYGTITPREAEDYIGCMRLAARIKELRSEGYPISMVLQKDKSRYGTPVMYAEYRLDREAMKKMKKNQ